ncbi:MAG: hypothetical protein AB7G08_32340, partial [Hyphomicrobiaceae bacterium]
MRLESHADATDPGEQIDEAKVAVSVISGISQRKQALANGIGGIRRRVGLSNLPSPQGACRDAQRLGPFPWVVASSKGAQALMDIMQ